MHPIAQGAASTLKQPAEPVAPQDTGGTASGSMALVAFSISVITLIKTLYTDLRGWMKGRGAIFESNIGSEVRTQLRSYDKSLSTLRAFSLRDPRALDTQKAEIEKIRPDWLNASYELTRLLAEVDEYQHIIEPGWAARFEKCASDAEAILLDLTEPTVNTVDELQQKAHEAYEILSAAIAEVRASLLAEQRSYQGVFRRLRVWPWRQRQ